MATDLEVCDLHSAITVSQKFERLYLKQEESYTFQYITWLFSNTMVQNKNTQIHVNRLKVNRDEQGDFTIPVSFKIINV